MEHVLRRIGKHGDIEHRWEVGVGDGRVEEAEKVFGEIIAKRGIAFAFDGPQGEGRQIETFEPGAREIVVFPQIAGGR
jgi:hypothetical protein